jgi:hypothetical protein
MEPPKTPDRRKKQEYDTIRRIRFFDAFDSKENGQTLAEICRQSDIDLPTRTARYWLQQRSQLGSPALRRTRRLSTGLGAPRKLGSIDLHPILEAGHPLHCEPYEAIIEALHLPVSTRTLQKELYHNYDARRFRKKRTTAISAKNKAARLQYAEEHQNKTITGFWQYVYFTDEAHFQSKDLSNRVEYELRPFGVQTTETMQEVDRSDLDVTLHVSAGISYNHKGVFHFYRDPIEPSLPRPYRPRRPRQSSVETAEEFASKVQEWDALKLVEVDIGPKGNAMTQQFYSKEVLPHHIEHIKWLQSKRHHVVHFQEDNDPSHGTRSSKNAPATAKADAGLQLLHHPAQSPDLNPIEGVWNVMKQRLRGGSWKSVAEFKAAVEAQWEQISRAEIRRRISEMPMRCNELIELKGGRVRTDRW